MTRIDEIAARLDACKGKPNESRAYAAFIGDVDGPSMDGSDGDVAYLLAEVRRLEAELAEAREVNAGSNRAYLDQMARAESAESLALSLAEARRHPRPARQGGVMTAYQPIDTIPLGEWVEVVSVKDKVRRARVRSITGTRWIKRADRYGPRRILCVTDKGGYIWARAWRMLR